MQPEESPDLSTKGSVMASLTPEQRAEIERLRLTMAKDFADALNRNAVYAHEQRMKRLQQNPETPPEA